MAKCQGEISAKELISDTFKPRIAVLCSPGAQATCEKNNLKFNQLIQPFATLTTEAQWTEPTGQNVFSKNIKISLVDLASWKPSDSDIKNSRRNLSTIVSNSPPYFINEDQTTVNNGGGGESVPIVNEDHCKAIKLKGVTTSYDINVPSLTPWFYTWRNVFLRNLGERNLLQHEFLNNFNACILVISTSESKTPEDLAAIISKLSKLQQQHQYEWPNTWLLPSILKFYLLVHDNSVERDSSGADSIYQSLKTTYGRNFCHLLKINSGGVEDSVDGTANVTNNFQNIWDYLFEKDYQYNNNKISLDDNKKNSFEAEDAIIAGDILHPLSPDSEYPPPSFSVSKNGDVEIINNELDQLEKVPSPHTPVGRYLTSQDLQNIQIAINEFIAKALFPFVERQARILYESILNRRGMSKSFLSATKRLFGTSVKPLTANSTMYTIESAEMITRKLADLYFLFGNYTGAYQFYHQLKKDFQADQAWIYYASSLEMAAISHFMMTHSEFFSPSKAFPLHYVNESITYYVDHCRMTDAATRCAIICCECLKKMENYGDAAALLIKMTSEDCDLRSALMLEQAAYCFLKLNSPRKYAFHSVLAGHRYSKAGLKFHALNCYLQAYQVYIGRGWKFASDHVYSTISRLQGLHLVKNEIPAFLKQLTIPLPQAPQQQVQVVQNPVAKLPLDFYFKFEFSHLKYISSLVSLAILRAQNSSEIETIDIEKIEFDPPDEIKIEEIGVGQSKEKAGKNSFTLSPLESRNIILKVRESEENTSTKKNERYNPQQPQPHPLLCINWRTIGEQKKTGQQKIKIKDFREKKESNPFIFQLRHDSKSQHDFINSPCFTSPIEMIIYSRIKCEVNLELNKFQQDEQQDSGTNLQMMPSSNYVYFVGQTSWTLQLDPVKETLISFYIAVTEPGIHNIGPSISIHSNTDIVDGKKIYNICSPMIIAQVE